METIKIGPNLYMIAGLGANVAVQMGAEGGVLVDSGTMQAVAGGARGGKEDHSASRDVRGGV